MLPDHLLSSYRAQVAMPVYVYPCIKSEDLQHVPTDVLHRLKLRVSNHACETSTRYRVTVNLIGRSLS